MSTLKLFLFRARQIMFRAFAVVAIIHLLWILVIISFPVLRMLATVCGRQILGGPSTWENFSHWAMVSYGAVPVGVLIGIWLMTILAIIWWRYNRQYFINRYWDPPKRQEPEKGPDDYIVTTKKL